LKAELEEVHQAAELESRKFQQREIELEADLSATQQSLEDLQHQLSTVSDTHQREKDLIRREHVESMEAVRNTS